MSMPGSHNNYTYNTLDYTIAIVCARVCVCGITAAAAAVHINYTFMARCNLHSTCIMCQHFNQPVKEPEAAEEEDSEESSWWNRKRHDDAVCICILLTE